MAYTNVICDWSLTRGSVLAAVAAIAYFLVVGVVTAVLPSPYFDRKLSVDIWNIVSLVVPALLFGPLAATYLVPWLNACRVGGRAGAGGALSFFAAGCPVCNKLGPGGAGIRTFASVYPTKGVRMIVP